MLQLSASAPRLPQGPAARTPRRSAPQPAAAESVRRQLERQAIIDLPAARQTGGAQLATGPPADPAGSAQPAVARSGPRRPADPDHLPQPARPSQQGLTPESIQLQQAAPAPALAQAAARRRPFTKRPVAPEGALSGAASEQRDSGTAPQHGSGRHAESSSRSSGGDGGIGTVGGGSGSIGAPPSGGAARLLERPQLLQPDKPKWPIALGGMQFWYQEEMFHFMGMLLASSPPRKPLRGQDKAVVLDLLSHHPRVADKVGPGIRRVIVAQHPARHGVHCFTLQRVDGSTVNFSYRKTLNALLGKPWSDTDLPDLVRLQQLASRLVQFHWRITAGEEQDTSDSTFLDLGGDKEAGFQAARDALIEDTYRAIAEIGSELSPRVAYMAMNCLAHCARHDAKCALQIVQDPRFMVVEAQLTRPGLRALVAERFTHLPMMLWSISVLRYVPRNGALEEIAEILREASPRLNAIQLSNVSRSYMCLADIYLPPLRLLQSVAARVCELTGQHLAAPSTVANFLYNIAAMGVLGPQQAAGLTDFLYRKRRECTRTELSMVLTALGQSCQAEGLPRPRPSLVHGFLDAFLSQMDSLDQCAAAAPAIIASSPQAPPLARALSGLQQLGHMPTPSQLLHLCSLLDANAAALQAPHEALSALAALGCIRPKSAQHGGGFVGHFAAACRGKLLDGSGAAAAPVATAWALAIMQECHVEGYREVWEAACESVHGGDETKVLKLFHTAVILHTEVPELADVRLRRSVAQQAQRLWLQQASDVGSGPTSAMHRQVAAALTTLGLSYVVEYVTEDGLFSIDIVLRPPKSRGPAAASAASSRLAAVRFAPADGGNGDGSGSGSAAEASTGKSVDDNRPGASRAVADSWQGAGGVAPQEDDSPKVADLRPLSSRRQALPVEPQPLLARLPDGVAAPPAEDQATERGRFSLLAPGARLKGDRAGDNGESAPDVDPELAALMRDIAAGAGSPLAAADDAALTGEAAQGWRAGQSLGLKLHLEAGLRAAGLPKVAIEVDGPHHFASNTGMPLGRTLVRDRLLAARGWQVVSISANDWGDLAAGRDKAEYLALRLCRAGVPAERFGAVGPASELLAAADATSGPGTEPPTAASAASPTIEPPTAAAAADGSS